MVAIVEVMEMFWVLVLVFGDGLRAPRGPDGERGRGGAWVPRPAGGAELQRGAKSRTGCRRGVGPS